MHRPLLKANLLTEGSISVSFFHLQCIVVLYEESVLRIAAAEPHLDGEIRCIQTFLSACLITNLLSPQINLIRVEKATPTQVAGTGTFTCPPIKYWVRDIAHWG